MGAGYPCGKLAMEILCASGDKGKLRPESGSENEGNGNVWYGNEKSSVSYEET
eukprot:SAG25_NODE_5028_length_711_cov_5.516340_1_plen_53_part_00